MEQQKTVAELSDGDLALIIIDHQDVVARSQQQITLARQELDNRRAAAAEKPEVIEKGSLKKVAGGK